MDDSFEAMKVVSRSKAILDMPLPALEIAHLAHQLKAILERLQSHSEAVGAHLHSLRAELTRRRKENHDDFRKRKWNSELILKREQTALLDLDRRATRRGEQTSVRPPPSARFEPVRRKGEQRMASNTELEELKIALLKQFAKTEWYTLPDDVATYIAWNIRSNSRRELEGAVIRIVTCAALTRQELTLAFAQQVFGYTPTSQPYLWYVLPVTH